MRFNSLLILLVLFLSFSCQKDKNKSISADPVRFDIAVDLLLAQYDCKTDVDDLHSVAAFASLLAHSPYSKMKRFAVAGSYGIQEGLYVPPNDLFQRAFRQDWADAHSDRIAALTRVQSEVEKILEEDGDIWIAEAGQSDFSAALIRNLQKNNPGLETSKRIHIVQHSTWNEEVTSAESLAFVKKYSDYHKIPDGNVIDNGTPGFRAPNFSNWKSKLQNPELLQIWMMAVDMGVKYNGAEGRYNNEAIGSGGLDFSDLSEICWILGIEDIRDAEEFFARFGL